MAEELSSGNAEDPQAQKDRGGLTTTVQNLTTGESKGLLEGGGQEVGTDNKATPSGS